MSADYLESHDPDAGQLRRPLVPWPYLPGDTTVIVEPTGGGRHREKRQHDFAGLTIRTYGATCIAVAIVMNGLYVLAWLDRFELPSVPEATAITFMLGGSALLNTGLILLFAMTFIARVHRRLRRFEQLLATAGFETR